MDNNTYSKALNSCLKSNIIKQVANMSNNFNCVNNFWNKTIISASRANICDDNSNYSDNKTVKEFDHQSYSNYNLSQKNDLQDDLISFSGILLHLL
jgi:hypothetical protein